MHKISFFSDGVRDSNKLLIGSSDIPIIIKTIGTKVQTSKRELWLQKRKIIEGFQGNESTWFGHQLEPIIVARHIKDFFGEEAAYKFKIDSIIHEKSRDIKTYEPPTEYKPYTEAVHDKLPWAIAHADAIYFQEEDKEITCPKCESKDIYSPNIRIECSNSCGFIINTKPHLIEAKTGRFFSRVKRENMEGFNLSDDKDVEDYNKIPAEVMLQVQWQMLCYGVDFVYVILFVDNQFYRFEIPAFKKWWPFIIEKVSHFVNDCANNISPGPEKKEDVFSMFDDIKDKSVYVTGTRAIIASQMKSEKKKLNGLIKKYKEKVSDINDAAVLLLGENKYLFNGENAEKLFSQSKYMQYNPISEKDLEPEDKIKYEKLGVLKKSERRKVN